MPIGDFVNNIPPVGFLAIHIVLFLVGATPAILAFAIRRTVEEPEVWREREVRRERPLERARAAAP